MLDIIPDEYKKTIRNINIRKKNISREKKKPVFDAKFYTRL